MGRKLKRLMARGDLVGELHLDQWLRFTDKNGTGYCQPDAYIVSDEAILLIEVKLTQTQTAHTQMLKLYLPLLRMMYEKPVVCLQIFKNARAVIPAKWKIKHPEELQRFPERGVFNWQVLQ